MDKPFIRIGNLTLNKSHIIEVDHDYVKVQLLEDEILHYVRVTTHAIEIGGDADISAIASVSVCHDFLHGTPETEALLSWLEDQTEVLA